jgi:chloramphenicol O-acetyltransferase type B
LKKFIKIILTKIFTRNAKLKVASFGDGSKVNFPCKFTTRTFIGKNCHFNGMVVSGNGKVSIGRNFHSGKECMIISSYHNYDKGTRIPYDDTYIDKDVAIEDNVWLGSRVIILGGVTIGEGAVIQAGSVVTSDIPKFGVAGGHPAKVFKYRDIEHYIALKD